MIEQLFKILSSVLGGNSSFRKQPVKDPSGPSRFFLNCNDGIPPFRVRELKYKWGDQLLIGVDPGLGDTPDEDAKATLKAALAENLSTHIYLVGVGMLSWSEEEARQIKEHAKSVGIDVDTQSDWHTSWKKWGWEMKAQQQFKYYWDNYGAYSCEIDNLDGVWDQMVESNLNFYKRFSRWLSDEGIETRLMMKNLSPDQLLAVVAAVSDGSLRRSFLADFAMFEDSSGDPQEQIRLCNKLGIRAITPISGITDTNNYGVVPEGVVGP